MPVKPAKKKARKKLKIPKGVNIRKSLLLREGESKIVRKAKVKARQSLVKFFNKL